MLKLPTLRLGSKGTYVKKLKIDLNGLSINYNNFIIDDIFDLKIKEVVENFQDEVKLPRDGIVGSATWASLIKKIRLIQVKLNSRGYNSGNPDGWFSAITMNAIKKFQKDNGLYEEGIINPRTRVKLFNPYPKDDFENRPSSNDLRSLNPYVAFLATKFLTLTKAHNLDVRIIAAFRSWDEEDRLYASGRTIPGPIVTNARGGNSYHNWGLAFDAAPFEYNQISNDNAKFKKMGSLGEQVGLKWGGSFKAIVDLPHFQYTFDLSTEDLLNGKRPLLP
jgi:peptidoglycan L-alanyl-D-glutamate endopeptidase CwlK